MLSQEYYSQNRDLINRYLDFIKSSKLPNRELLTIVREINRLEALNKALSHGSIEVHTVEIPSKLNLNHFTLV